MDGRFVIATKMERSNSVIANLEKAGLVSRLVTEREALAKVAGEKVLLLSWPYLLTAEFISWQQAILSVHNSLLPKYRGRHAFA